MSKLLVFQHVASEPLGHLDPLLRASGIRIRYVNFGREAQAQPDIRRYDGLIVLGGPMNVDQVQQFPHLKTEIELIREAVNAQKPVLGICLGGQLLAAAMGDGYSRMPFPKLAGTACTPVRGPMATGCSAISSRRRATSSSGTRTRSSRRRRPCRSRGPAAAGNRPIDWAITHGDCSFTSKPMPP